MLVYNAMYYSVIYVVHMSSYKFECVHVYGTYMSAIEIIITMLTTTVPVMATMTRVERIKNNKFAGLAWGKLNFRIPKRHGDRNDCTDHSTTTTIMMIIHNNNNNDSFCLCQQKKKKKENKNQLVKSTSTIIIIEHMLRCVVQICLSTTTSKAHQRQNANEANPQHNKRFHA